MQTDVRCAYIFEGVDVVGLEKESQTVISLEKPFSCNSLDKGKIVKQNFEFPSWQCLILDELSRTNATKAKVPYQVDDKKSELM